MTVHNDVWKTLPQFVWKLTAALRHINIAAMVLADHESREHLLQLVGSTCRTFAPCKGEALVTHKLVLAEPES